jgi:mycothiol synthase
VSHPTPGNEPAGAGCAGAVVVGLCAFFKQVPGLMLVPSKRRYLVPPTSGYPSPNLPLKGTFGRVLRKRQPLGRHNWALQTVCLVLCSNHGLLLVVSQMKNSTINPPPPSLDGLLWRPITRDDLAELVDLAKTCYLSDGGLQFMVEPEEIISRFFPDEPGAAIGALNADGQLVACNTVTVSGDSSTLRATIVGYVRPVMRGRGFGTYLMRWSQVQAESLLAGAAADQRVLQVNTESLTESAHRLYLAHGFQHVFESLVMRRDLDMPLPDQRLPDGVTLTAWQPVVAEEFYRAYHAAFRGRPGFPGWSAAEWIARVTENDHIPEWSLLARAGGVPLGFVIGNTDLTTDPPGGFVWQIGVVPAARRRGLGSALLVETMRRMRAAGAPWADLTVHTNNPGAIQTYAELGFVTIGRRARYERIVKQ